MPEEEKKPEVEIKEEPEVEKPEETVEVDVSKPAVEKEKPKVDYATREELLHIQNQIAAGRRVSDKVLRRMEELSERLSQPIIGGARPKSEATPDKEPDYYDQLAYEKGWQTAVEALAEKKAQEVLKKTQEEFSRIEQDQQSVTILEKAKKEVGELYPELNDENSEHSRVLMEVISEHQDFLRNPYGPVLATREMERKLRQAGKAHMVRAEQPIISDSSHPAQAFIPPGRARVSSDKVVLTREQLEFCKFHNIDPKNYARTVKEMPKAKGGGIEV